MFSQIINGGHKYMYDGIAWYCLDGSHLKIDRSFGNADTPGWGRTHISL